MKTENDDNLLRLRSAVYCWSSLNIISCRVRVGTYRCRTMIGPEHCDLFEQNLEFERVAVAHHRSQLSCCEYKSFDTFENHNL